MFAFGMLIALLCIATMAIESVLRNDACNDLAECKDFYQPFMTIFKVFVASGYIFFGVLLEFRYLSCFFCFLL